jgi:small nuclear ribonucleoprotein (snRNP)-like protein
MRKPVAVILGMLMATLTMSGVGIAQGVTTIQGTIQAVDCQTNALVVNASDGTHVFPVGPYTAVYVNSAPVSFCTLQRYIGKNVTVSLAPSGNQVVLERVDVSVGASPAPAPNPPAAISGLPDWAKVAIALVVIGGLVYIGTQRHDAPAQNQDCYDSDWGRWCRSRQ